MRIIAGEFRGRILLPPDTDLTRPITDRVKQSLFDILSPRIEGARIYDCFSGTGSMGLECLSRGAVMATFFEADRSALVRLKKNIASLKVENHCRVMAGDIFRMLRDPQPAQERIDLVFLDPPYRFLRQCPDQLKTLAAMLADNHLADEGLVIFRHDAADSLTLPGLNSVETRTYGQMTLEFLEKSGKT